MALDHPTDDGTTVVGSIAIDVIIKNDGSYGTAYGLDGIGKEHALGYLISVTDRIRKEIEFGWDTCPQCLRPWSEHDVESEEDDDE